MVRTLLPVTANGGDSRRFRASYIVRLRGPNDVIGTCISQSYEDSGPIGQLGVRDCVEYGVPFSDHLTLPDSVATRDSVLKMDVGYMFLPEAWGKGYCPEALAAFLQAYHDASDFWAPYPGVWIQAIVVPTNVKSQKVVEKAGFKHLG